MTAPEPLELFAAEDPRERARRDAEDLVAALRRDGMRRAEHGTDKAWARWAEEAIRKLAATGQPFTFAEIYGPPHNVPQPPSSKVQGALMGALARKGIVRHVGYQKSMLPTTHGATVKIWIGTT